MTTKTYLVEMPEGWKPENEPRKDGGPEMCQKCPFCEARSPNSEDEDDYCCIPGQCPLANAKEAVEVKFEIDKETGLSVIDKNGKFHFEGHDKYFAVEDK